MRNIKFTFAFILVACIGLNVQSANAKTLNETSPVSNVKVSSEKNEPKLLIKSEGAYSLKDGQLDEINKLKLTFPSSMDHVLIDKKITFQQTHVMVLPIMGMVHFVGMLDVGGVKGIVSFQLGFTINPDQSLSFKGNKTIKLNDVASELPKHELMLTLDFDLKNDKNALAVVTAK